MVATYRAHPLTELAAAALAKVSHAALPNIVLGREVVPELLGWRRATPAALAAAAARLLNVGIACQISLLLATSCLRTMPFYSRNKGFTCVG